MPHNQNAGYVIRKSRSKSNITVDTLYSVHYAYAQWPQPRSWLAHTKRAVLNEYESMKKSGQGEHFPLFTESYLAQKVKTKLRTELLDWFAACAQAFLKSIAPKLEVAVTRDCVATLWANVNTAGEFHSSHNHAVGEYLLSGVFFVNAPRDLQEREGLLVLERTALPGVGGRFDLVYEPDSKVSIRPIPGWLILFPPFVRHYVTPHSSREPRISIAFNVTWDAVSARKTATNRR